MDTAQRKAPAEVFPPGDFIREELEARQWTQSDLAAIMDRPVETINRLIAGKLAVTPETARGLAAAFGTSAELWLNLESAYRLARVKNDEAVARRARLYGIAPIKDILKRRWIEPSGEVDVLERQVMRLYELRSIDDDPHMPADARQATGHDRPQQAQIAWLFFARRLAASIQAPSYTKAKLEKAIQRLRGLAALPSDAAHVPEVLVTAGVRLVIVEHLPQSRIDGAAFWLSKNRPVVALSLRYDRIDYLWHALLHEVAHILHGDALAVDLDLVGKDAPPPGARPAVEVAADRFAGDTLIAPEALEAFIARARPLYAKKRILDFASEVGVHPGIVVGRLQQRQEIGPAHSRELLVPIRDIVTRAALTDGWGQRATCERD